MCWFNHYRPLGMAPSTDHQHECSKPHISLLGSYTPMFMNPKDSMERHWRERPADQIDHKFSEEEGKTFADLWLGSKRLGSYHR
jgi:hypothetical protein